jgi:hypothetical protein
MVASLALVAGCGTAMLLPDGRVLLIDIVAKAYDPATGQVSNLATPPTIRAYATATLLDDGRVLIAGGTGGIGGAVSVDGQSADPSSQTLATAELYDPVTDTYAPTGSMAAPRALHTATRLADGRVLIVGGGVTEPGQSTAPGVDTLPPPEIYDPATGSFGPAGGNTVIPRIFSSATLLPDGKVLIAGGMSASPAADGASPVPDFQGAPTAQAELFDPATGTFSATGPMTMARVWHTATALPDGRVLVVGGTHDTDTIATTSSVDPTALTAEIYDPATGTFSATGAPAQQRVGHAAALLADGRVLVTGGTDSDPITPESLSRSAELFDPVTGTFASTGDMVTGHAFHTATTLADGGVLVAGFGEEALTGLGVGGNAMPDLLTSAELYDPATGTFSTVEVEPAVIPLPSLAA